MTSIAILLGLMVPLLFSAPTVAAQCHTKALENLRKLSPEGYRVYQKAGNAKDFLHWVTCDDVQLGLSTAVHETVHLLTEKLNAYPLINGRQLPRVHQRRTFFPPRSVHDRFDPRSTYVSTYLGPGAATSADEFGYLLDELNAYTHDLATAVKLDSIASRDREVYHRDGLAALMAFVASYVEEARRNRPETWKELSQPQVRHVVSTLWEQAETEMGRSCRTRNYGHEAPRFLEPVCRANVRHGLGHLLGRPPLCPVRCTREEVSTAEGPVFERTATLEISSDGSSPTRSVRERIVEDEPTPRARRADRTASSGSGREARSSLGAPRGQPPSPPAAEDKADLLPPAVALPSVAPPPLAALETWPFIVRTPAQSDRRAPPRSSIGQPSPVDRTPPPAAREPKPILPPPNIVRAPPAPPLPPQTNVAARPLPSVAAAKPLPTTATTSARSTEESVAKSAIAGVQTLRAPLSAPVEAMMRWRGMLR